MKFLPEMSSEDLDQGDLEGRDFAVHEDTREIKLDLETDVHVSSVDCWRPPKSESSVRDLIES